MPLALLRQLAHEMLGCLLVLVQHGVLHADIKPENIMVDTAVMAPGGGAGSAGCGARPRFKLIDFSNAMGLGEQAAYHDAFDVQTLSYRAPEVIYGQPFGHAIDAWSLGVSLAELFGGKVLVQAASRGGLAVQVAQLLGRPPRGAFAQSKYAAELLPLVQHQPEALSHAALRNKLAAELGAGPSQQEHQLMDLLAALLAYDPAARLTPLQALSHDFFADAFPMCALLPAAAAAATAEAASADTKPPGLAAARPGLGRSAAPEPPPSLHTPRLGKRTAEQACPGAAPPTVVPRLGELGH